MKVCHITSVHTSTDIRIFTKQCVSLSKSGYDVTLIATNEHDEVRDGVKIKALTKRSTALGRLFFNLPSVLFYTIKNRYDVYHAHDPELIPILLVLHFLGRNVVYDMHENFPKQLMVKKIPLLVKKTIHFIWPKLESFVFKRINLVFAETSYIKDYPYVKKYIDVLNMPLEDLNGVRAKKHDMFTIGYVGGVNEDRYCLKILETLLKLQKKGVAIRFECIGPVCSQETQRAIDCYFPLLKNVHFYGALPPKIAWQKIAKCHVGIAMLMPLPNYIESYPTKMFEYLAMGLPVITSNFELYKPIIVDNKVGYCVDPLDIDQFEKSLLSIVKDPVLLKKMQDCTSKVFEGKYTWDDQFNKLIVFYSEIASIY